MLERDVQQLCYLVHRKNLANKARRKYLRLAKGRRKRYQSAKFIDFFLAMKAQAEHEGKTIMRQIKPLKKQLDLHLCWDSSGTAYAIATSPNSSYSARVSDIRFTTRAIEQIAEDYLFYEALEEALQQ